MRRLTRQPNTRRGFCCSHRNSEQGSGSILVLAVLGALFAVTAVLVPVLALLPTNQAVQGAADAAALAAADTASGLLPGVPCEAATRAAEVNGVRLSSCTVDDLIATVSVAHSVGIITIGSRARAGPAP
ncbi:flp pilus-assembly TadE/G-like family protein [Cryobacterium sp. 1639]|uniref:Rv3654c family TadE-like protein n=1 Tax=Cryobacterium inferilacus TaxID=2866629 RepID=UPI001C73D03B|nr:Rv3654c family TadE-like protein [Cryobacterium sp. 1639]MBX0299875.1 flp pilus-assembly TadE/G-like family protein [Cryobacterium sp. 1639]